MQDSTKVTYQRLLGYLQNYKAAFAAGVVAMLCYAAVDASFIALLKPFMDDGLTAQNEAVLAYAPFVVVGLFFLRGVFSFASTYLISWVGTNVVMQMRQQLFEHYLKLPVAFHDGQSTGDLLSRITFDTEQVYNASSKAMVVLVREGAFVIGMLGIMFYTNWKLSLSFIVIAPLIAVCVAIVSKRFRKVGKSIQSAMGGVTTTSEQMLNGHKEVLMFGGQEKEIQRFKQVNNHNRLQNMKMTTAKAVSNPVIQMLAAVGLASALFMIGSGLIGEKPTPGEFTAVISAMVSMMRPLKQLTNVNSEFQRGMAACQTIFALLDKATEEDKGSKQIERVKGAVSFNNVTFSYPGKEDPTLKNVSFDLPAGQTLALVGRSGSGKSTITSLLARFYNPQQGEITLDEHKIDSLTLSSLRNQFALVSQHVTLFNDSIANNIAYGRPDATQEQIRSAAQAAHVLEFTDTLEQGLDTQIGENGVNLSGGQRQRIAIARAILCDAPILILDEATSALDTESERQIQQALETLQQGRTCIVIAHRLSTIESADKILVVHRGEIEESGTHQSLLAQKGIYSQLHQMQYGDA